MDEQPLQTAPPVVYYIPNFITDSEEKLILEKVQNAPKPKWTQLTNRRLQNWGGIPHPNGMISEIIPQWLQEVTDKVARLGAFEDNVKPNHVLINEYQTGQGIMPHFDGPLFYPTIATISCASHAILKFIKPDKLQAGSQKGPEEKDIISILLEPKSLLVLKESMYHDYQHYIEEVHQDVVTDSLVNLSKTLQHNSIGETLQRSTRISLTIRHVPKTSKIKIKLGR